MMIASKGQYSAQKPQFMQMSTSMKNSVGSGIGRPVFGSFERTIQIHCGGQTLAQIPQDVHRCSRFPSGVSSYTRNGTKRISSGAINLSSGYWMVKMPFVSLLERCLMPSSVK